MGNLCGKSSEERFTGPGRTLGSAPPPQNASAPVPRKLPPKPTGPGRTLATDTNDQGDARSAAARAAEERANKAQSQPKGKLGETLAAQKRQTDREALEQHEHGTEDF